MNFWTDPLKLAADWLIGLLTSWGIPVGVATGIAAFLGILLLISLLMVVDILLVWVERKVVARFQDRLGPNRLGPFGLIQPFADIIKLLIKEDITPANADKVVYNLAPILSMMSVLILWAIVPLAPSILGVDLNIGVLFLIAAGSIGTLSIIMAGLRGGAQKITEAVVSDGSGAMRITWFSEYAARNLEIGEPIVLSGKIDQYLGRKVMNNPHWETIDQQQLSTNRIVPVYPLTARITQKWLRHQIAPGPGLLGKAYTRATTTCLAAICWTG